MCRRSPCPPDGDQVVRPHYVAHTIELLAHYAPVPSGFRDLLASEGELQPGIAEEVVSSARTVAEIIEHKDADGRFIPHSEPPWCAGCAGCFSRVSKGCAVVQ